MTDGTFETLLATASSEHGASYLDARDKILALDPRDLQAAMPELEAASTDRADWRRQLTAEMITGWIVNKETYERCTKYAGGDLPGPRPLPGFTAKHRAEAIVSLGDVATPRVLEMVWKIADHGDAVESSALFGALAKLQDHRAVMPMIDLMPCSRGLKPL